MPNLLDQPTKVLLTGGTSGIGARMADRLLSEGHQVVMLACRASQLPECPGMFAIDCNLADTPALRAALPGIAASHPDIALILNNAAVQYDTQLTDPAFDPARMADEVAINLLAPALIVQALLAPMRSRGLPGAIVNVTSGLAFFPKQQSALYCATKAGLHSFSQSLRYQLEGTPIRVIEAVLPMVDTPMTAGRGHGKISAKAAADAILDGIAGGRDEVLIGKSKLIPWLARLAPGVGRRALRGK